MADRFEYKSESLSSVFYGYVRGCPTNEKIFFVPGYGDYHLTEIKEENDPIPGLEETKKKKTHRTLKQKEKALYAPSSNVGMLKYDESTGYLNLPERYVMFSKHDGEDVNEFTEGQKMVRYLQETEGDFEGLTNSLLLLKDSSVKIDKVPEILEKKQDFTEIVKELQEKLPSLGQEYFFDDTLMTNLEVLVYGKGNQPGRKVIKKNENDTFKARYTPKYNDTDSYVGLIKSRFMAGTDFFDTSAKNEQDNEEEQEYVEKKLEKTGIKLGVYVKIEIQGMDLEVFNSINPDKPLILCGVKPMENTLGFIRTRIKTHR